MATLDVFKADAFSTMSLLKAVEKVDHKPQFLGELGIFTPEPTRSKTVAVEERDGTLALVPTSPRGAPLDQRKTEKRNVRNFECVRLAKGDRIMADEIQDIRAFGSESEMMQVQDEVARRIAGPAGLLPEIELTWENMRLGAVQGIVTDADGSVVMNFFTEFGISQPSEIAFDIANTAEGDLRPKIEQNVVRPMIRNAKGAFTTSTRVVGLCGDNFWDDLVNHVEVRKTYLNQQEAPVLRQGTAFGSFRYAGVDWFNYRGTDDNSTVAVATDTVKFFPVGARDVFSVAWAPAEFLPFVNTLGQPSYPMVILDDKRQAFVDIEVYSYPLFMCKQPKVLLRGKRGA
jgi:hypothetical protein